MPTKPTNSSFLVLFDPSQYIFSDKNIQVIIFIKNRKKRKKKKNPKRFPHTLFPHSPSHLPYLQPHNHSRTTLHGQTFHSLATMPPLFRHNPKLTHIIPWPLYSSTLLIHWLGHQKSVCFSSNYLFFWMFLIEYDFYIYNFTKSKSHCEDQDLNLTGQLLGLKMVILEDVLTLDRGFYNFYEVFTCFIKRGKTRKPLQYIF